MLVYQISKAANNPCVDIYDIRRQNLTLICKDLGGPAKLAKILGKSEAQISHILGARKQYRNIGSGLARGIEKQLKLPTGDLDIPHQAKIIMYSEVLRDIVDRASRLDPATQKHILALIEKLSA